MFEWLNQPFTPMTVLGMVIGGVIVLSVILLVVAYSIYAQRKILAAMHLRIGPNRVGPFGLFQSFADILKLLLKEDIVPAKADKAMFLIGPMITYVPSFMVLAVIPYTATHLFTAELNVGVLYYIALSSISVIGVVLGAWASNNKYSIIGGLRSAAQLISYEIPLALSILGVILMAGSMNIVEIVEAQKNMWFIVPQIIGFSVFIIAAMAELSRVPFDLPEAESELVAGYSTEYSGFRFAFYMLAEYVYITAMGGLAAALYLGGWEGPLLPGWAWYGIKAGLFIFLTFWLQGTFPRIRNTLLMTFSWKVLIPISILNIILTAIIKIAVA
jgi:NADH-quinone oxidoreductase subunit H